MTRERLKPNRDVRMGLICYENMVDASSAQSL